MMMTLAPFVTMELIWFCCSATVLLAGAYWTLGLNPALVRPSVNSWPARTQFSEVLSGSATPMDEPSGKPAAGVAPLLDPPPEPPRLEQPASAMAAIVAIAADARMTFFMSTSLGEANEPPSAAGTEVPGTNGVLWPTRRGGGL